MAFRDAEGFQEILFALERFGTTCTHKYGTLHVYQDKITKFAARSPLAEVVPLKHRGYHKSAKTLYKRVEKARNDALHQGAVARTLTADATELALILEDALMIDSEKVADYMVRQPVCAYDWQPISFLRQQMLSNQFSYLPLLSKREGTLGTWQLITDGIMAKFLRNQAKRKDRLAMTVTEATKLDLRPIDAKWCDDETSVAEILTDVEQGKPVLVVDKKDHTILVGIITAFDLMCGDPALAETPLKCAGECP